jgi:hypothetical protein
MLKKKSPAPLSERDRLGFAIAQFRGKFQDKYPAGSEYKNLREKDPKMFAAVLTILKNDMSGNLLACSADVEDFKKNPTMVKAQAIIDKYILDPKLGDSSTGKPHHINIYESQYQKFLVNYESAKFALAYQSADAKDKLACVFDPILSALIDAERNINNNIRAEINLFKADNVDR